MEGGTTIGGTILEEGTTLGRSRDARSGWPLEIEEQDKIGVEVLG